LFVQEYLDGAPEDVVTIVNYRGQYNAPWDALYERFWAGFVKSVRFSKGRRATVVCVPAQAEIGTSGLALRCGRLCQVPLYSSSCGVTQSSYLNGGTVDAIDGYTVDSTTFAEKADGYWTGAPFTANGATRLVIKHVYDTITLNDSIPGLTVGMTFEVYAGCDRTISTCNSRFSNALNFRGQPHIPDMNVFQTGVHIE
jgi:uncharacterized phage protein (TIGR02218 family)